MNTLKLLHQEIDHTPEPILREVYHYLMFLRSQAPLDDGDDEGAILAFDHGADTPKPGTGGPKEDDDWRDPYELGKDLFGRFAPSDPPADACLVRLAGQEKTNRILTTDWQDFDTYRTPGGRPFERLWSDYGAP